ncbi:MAG: ubiquitin-like domain-containing protein [Candidatus Promineifilaceae bacterium]
MAAHWPPHRLSATHLRAWLAGAFAALALVACGARLPAGPSGGFEVELTAGGETRQLTTHAANVRELLADLGLEPAEADIVDPPLFTPLSDDLEVRLVRVTASVEVIEQRLPFGRRVVRNESMSRDDPPIIIQAGQPGSQAVSVRIIYHDGLEFGRQELAVETVTEAQDEIVMIGVGADPGSVPFPGLLAFVSNNVGVVFRGASNVPEQLATGADLDRRVFALSPSGAHLLFTRLEDGASTFNSLWVIGTRRGVEARPLGVSNVLWAGWNPDRLGQPQIALSTGVKTELLPGWEANNDLWIGDLPPNAEVEFRPEQVVESYHATYAWWGGNYAWSPQGRYIAYSHANEVGLIDTTVEEAEVQRTRLDTFFEYNTRADWVWLPSLAWSPDGQFLAYSRHAGEDADSGRFDLWVARLSDGLRLPFMELSGIWSHPFWSPPDGSDSRIALLRAAAPLESQSSNYTLWLIDRDGSNARQIYPSAGETSRFPREANVLAWGPDGLMIAFVYDDGLYLFNLEDNLARRLTPSDSAASNPTWAPYGRALNQLAAGALADPS